MTAAPEFERYHRFENAIQVQELRMAYADSPPPLDDYLDIANNLINAGNFSAAAELITRVTDTQRDFPVRIGGRAGLHVRTLATAQILMGDCEGALRLIEAHPNSPCVDIAPVANYKLAMSKPEGADRAALIATSDAALKGLVGDMSRADAHGLAFLAGIYFDMDRVAEALQCLERLEETRPRDRLEFELVHRLPHRPSVRHSTQRELILASVVWTYRPLLTRVAVRHPDWYEADCDSVEFDFNLPAVVAPPRHKILSVRDLQAHRAASPANRPRGESEAKR